MSTTTAPAHPAHEPLLARRFAVAWVFLLVSATLGALLRFVPLAPIDALNYGHVLHAHSHVAFLGWVFNAFFVAALRHFIPPERTRSYDALWWTMQVAVLGMLASFPAQGYGAVSITFSTLHMGASALFGWRLWRENRAEAGALFFLRAALLCMVASGLGPLALGPLAALDLHHSPAYLLAIYFYLHFQCNGWFVFFLLALWLQHRATSGTPVPAGRVRLAGTLLAAGCVLTYALSALWLAPPAWVQVTALAGGAAQVAGGVLLVAAARGSATVQRRGVSMILWRVAVASLLLKLLLQFAGALPGLTALTAHRFIAIAFLHLIFLGLVTPGLVLWAIEAGWLRAGLRRTAGVLLYLAGTAATEVVLVLPTLLALLGWSVALPIPTLLFAAAAVLVAGIALLGAGLRMPPCRASRPTPHGNWRGDRLRHHR